MEETKAERAKALISFAGNITGSALGGTFGLLAGGPIGAVGGAIAGPIIASCVDMLADVALRSLSERERMRVGAGAVYALSKINSRLEAGDVPRNDGFFDREANGRSPSDEILEGALLKCRNEHEEKKLRLLGNIYANTSFSPDVIPSGANWLLQTAQRLTYRQLCIIALVKRAKHKGVSWGPGDGDPAFQMEYQEIDFMLARDHSPDSVRMSEETGEGLRVVDLSRVGQFCHDLMSLEDIPQSELQLLDRHFPRALE